MFAEGLAPDGICIDAEGSIWTSTGVSSVVRVADGGRVLERVELSGHRALPGLMLGGKDRRTLFIVSWDWDPAEDAGTNLQRLATGPRTGEILTLRVSVPGAGRP